MQEENRHYATHGYSPNKPEYQSNLIISDEGIKSEYKIGTVQMVDIAPTIAKILGVEFPECDGWVLHEIFMN